REPGVAPEVLKFARSWHHAEVDLAIREFDLDAADPRRAVLAEGRQCFVFADGKPPCHLAGQCRLGRRELGPAGRQPAPNQRWRKGKRYRSVRKFSSRRAVAKFSLTSAS